MKTVLFENGSPRSFPIVMVRCGYDMEMDEHSLKIGWSPRDSVSFYEPIYRHGFRFTYWRPMYIHFSNLWPFRVRWW